MQLKENKLKLVQLKLKNLPKLEISKELRRKIDYFHEKVGNIEWSGVLEAHISGIIDLNNLHKMRILAKDMLICDIGTSAFTSYNYTEHTEEIEEHLPELSLFNIANWWNGSTIKSGPKMCQIHTHHSMETFFSETDLTDLRENTEYHGFYISLIVNKKGVYSAKGAFVGEVEYQPKITNNNFNIVAYEEQVKEKRVFSFDIEIIGNKKIKIDQILEDRLAYLKGRKAAAGELKRQERERTKTLSIAKNYGTYPNTAQKSSSGLKGNLDLANYQVMNFDFFGEVYFNTINKKFYDLGGALFCQAEQEILNNLRNKSGK